MGARGRKVKVDTHNIEFINERSWLTKDSISCPSPAFKNISNWYKDGDRFVKDPHSEDFYVSPDKGKIPTWKACPAIFDVVTSGYYLLTPCDIEFYLDKDNKISCDIKDGKNKGFCTPRQDMPQFHKPDGYYDQHFAWTIDWGVKLPNGYSALYLQPMNRFELPFLNTSGVIDNDKMHNAGSLPFFLKDGWAGVISAGTPYVQIFPFKRENWESNISIVDSETIYKNMEQVAQKYRVPDGGVYQKEVWEKRSYI